MTRILVTNAYSARNAGDAAILLGMVAGLRTTTGIVDAEVTVSSADHAGDAGRYPWAVVPSFQSLKKRIGHSDLLRGLYFLGALLPFSLVWATVYRLTGWRAPAPSLVGSLLRAHADADVVVAAGGGYLYTRSARHGFAVLGAQLYDFAYGVLLGKPVYLYAQSIGPFAGRLQERLVRSVLCNVRMVQVREERSLDLVSSWRLPVPVREVADAAFLLDPDRGGFLERARENERLTVGLTVRFWLRDPGDQSGYEDAVAEFVRWLLETHGAEVVFVPQVSYPDGDDDDREVARRVHARAGSPAAARVVADQLEAPQVMALCGDMDVFVGTRMHSNIFAMCMGVPALAVAYQPKTEGIMRQLGLDDFVVDIEKLSATTLQGCFERLLAHREEIRDQLGVAIPEMRRRALDGWSLIAADLAAADGGSQEGDSVGVGFRR